MKLRPSSAALASFTLFSALIAPAQQTGPQSGAPVPQFTDPANLRCERVKPRDGRELPIDQGARGLEQMLRKLNTRASLMLIVAHPDDEDGGMLTYYSRGLGARVAVLTLTRGEGGQNAMTGDFEDALGLLRTQELLSADRYLGVDQFFGTEVDFGFSKTKEEAFKKWTHERVLYDAVRSIRLYRPLVIAAVFIGGVTDGHGQHQVSGQIAQEAFKAAADPTVFPDMIAEGILPWQALKVYARVPMQSISSQGLYDYATGKYTAPRFENYVTGEVTTTVPSSDVVVHEGTPDPILSDDPATSPRSYVQFARIGLGMQKSQVGGRDRVPPAGTFDVSYHLYGSALCSSSNPLKNCHPERSAQRGVEGGVAAGFSPLPTFPQQNGASAPATLATYPNFFDGIDTSIEGIAGLAPSANGTISVVLQTNLRGIAKSIAEAKLDFKADHPELAANQLGTALELTRMTIQNVVSFGPELLPATEKLSVLHELHIKSVQLNDAMAMSLRAGVDATADNADIIQENQQVVHVSVSRPADVELRFPITVSGAGKNTVSETFLEFGVIDLHKPGSIEVHPKLRAYVTATATKPYFFRDSIDKPVYLLRDATLRNAPATPPALVARALYNYNGVGFAVERVVHNGLQPVRIVPGGSLSIATHAQVFPDKAQLTSLQSILSPIEKPAIEPQLALPSGWKSHLAISDGTAPGEMGIVVEAPPSPRTTEVISAVASLQDNKKITEGYRPIGYGDLPRTNYYTPATVRIVPVDLNLPHARIAYLPGTGDAVPEALFSINLKPDTLTVADLTPAKLAQYDTVILGVRTYAAHPDLHGAPTKALLDYARNGGNVLVQYQTTEFTGADAPYPFDLGSNERVVDETDPVQLLDAKAAFLTAPNKITPADFNGWVEERGHGFLESWDPHYTALTETHDPDEDPQRGGLITTNLGKGRWTYCAFALYRQLPEAVPGAYRLFVNLLTPSTARN